MIIIEIVPMMTPAKLATVDATNDIAPTATNTMENMPPITTASNRMVRMIIDTILKTLLLRQTRTTFFI
jgi:hypothetical protein